MPCLQYPLSLNSEWGYNYLRRKQVKGKENVTTSAGNFECYKLEYLFYSSILQSDYSSYEYISDKGLIKRTCSEDSCIYVYSNTNMDTVATLSYKESLVLTDLNF